MNPVSNLLKSIGLCRRRTLSALSGVCLNQTAAELQKIFCISKSTLKNSFPPFWSYPKIPVESIWSIPMEALYILKSLPASM